MKRHPILIVDDDPMSRKLHQTMLGEAFDPTCVDSGGAAIEACKRNDFSLILLDIMMPDMDGIETCQALTQLTHAPIIFVTGHDSMEAHLQAYEAGGSDIITKPVRLEILRRKALLAIKQQEHDRQMDDENASLQKMAMDFLSTLGQNGTLLNFMRQAVTCRSHQSLAEKLLQATTDLGISCTVLIRHPDGPTILTPKGEATPLERSILEQSAGMGRVFQFRRQLVVNYDRVSLLVSNMPDDTAHALEAGRIRDNIAILAEATEGLCDAVDMRIESMRRAEQMQIALGDAFSALENLRKEHKMMLHDTHCLLQELVDKVESTYAWMGTSNKQEETISRTMDESVQKILQLLLETGDFDRQLQKVLMALNGGAGQQNIEIF